MIIELHVSLHGLECITRVQFSDEFSIIDTVNFVHCLNQNLSHGIAFCHVGADAIGCAAVRRQVVVDHLRVLEGVDRRVPAAVRNEDPLRGRGATNSFGELTALVRPRCSYEGLWIVVLLLEGLYKSSNVRKQRAGNYNLCLRGDHLLRDGGKVRGF